MALMAPGPTEIGGLAPRSPILVVVSVDVVRPQMEDWTRLIRARPERKGSKRGLIAGEPSSIAALMDPCRAALFEAVLLLLPADTNEQLPAHV